uniref:F-box domain-containing protein n=2 Tax=Kalanchoe fedtschenkoi TaxID=63787 RepID=A0A7N0VGV7_KALFE
MISLYFYQIVLCSTFDPPSLSFKTLAMDLDPLCRPWSDLPQELLGKISDSLDSRIDLRRLRSVCSPWRSVIPKPPCQDSRIWSVQSLEKKLHNTTKVLFSLVECNVYYLRSLSNPAQIGSIIKVEELGDGRVKALSPFSDSNLPGFQGILDLSNYKVIELKRFFYMKTLGEISGTGNHMKAVLFVDRPSINFNDLSFMGQIDDRLVQWTAGNVHRSRQDPVSIDFRSFGVASRRENLHILSYTWEFLFFDAFLNMEIYPEVPLCFGTGRKYLVESCGDLYFAAERLIVSEKHDEELDESLSRVGFVIYQFDSDLKQWCQVHSLGDQSFFVASDCSFSVSPREIPSLRRNCIYFAASDYGADDYYPEGCNKEPGAIGIFDIEKNGCVGCVFYGSDPSCSPFVWPPCANLLCISKKGVFNSLRHMLGKWSGCLLLKS